ncbi:baculoviral IAP repeat-containing protein 7-like isoform X2 [Mercenaria mercenaria]|uniref:baculoviral IAP repeat-containing protein 7-like isoform X2 n=1 Tax=Mercenaria mercenaria TaxID=6596 RepID=UPI00234E82A0|nr:baculoviral IAP repeat-containing protein 7-like isoform X2 [Mercenaria mercenaria]
MEAVFMLKRIRITTMIFDKNKNITCSGGRLLKIDYKDKFTWVDILDRSVLLANVFKDCLMLLQNKEVYVLTLTTGHLLATLQEQSDRKYLDLKEVDSTYGSYGSNHTLAIYWTVQGNARALTENLDTSRLFKEISEEIQEIKKSTAVLSVNFGDLICKNLKNELKIIQTTGTEKLYAVNFVNGIHYENDIYGRNKKIYRRRRNYCKSSKRKIISLAKLSKIIIPLNGEVLLNVIPHTGNQYHIRDEYPQQVSGEQENDGRSEIAFSNGASFLPFNSNLYVLGSSSSHTPIQPAVSDRSSSHARHSAYSDFNERLRTYARWTHRKPDPNQLSETGFFFTDQGDLVRCFQCGIGLKDFSEDDNPLIEHVRHSSRCPFLLEYLGQAQLSSILNQLRVQDPELNRQRQLELRPRTRPEVNFTVRHEEYQTFESRLLTFDKWPRQMIQTPRQLAEAGLYYTGFEDHVRCFACDGGLRRWDPEDDPWTEHCRWFPACPFARKEKGDEFIALVQASAEYGNERNNEDLSNAMEQMTLRDPVYNSALNEHKDTCLEMGYQQTDVNEAVQEIRNRGTILHSIDEILDAIEVIKERKRQAVELERKQNETPMEENQRLKRLIVCMFCGKNNVNALFLPCTHHRLCMECADPLTVCPVCERYIRQKIRTYLV